MEYSWSLFITDVLYMGKGSLLTVLLLIGGLALGIPLGIVLAIVLHKENFISHCIKRLVSIIRGTPLILQLSLVYFSFPMLLGVNLSIFWAGIFTFGINSSAYTTEIIRSGIGSVPIGQFEAAKTLEIPTFYVWKDIILPQVVRNVAPALVNEAISLLKETAIISTIGGMDIMRISQHVAAERFDYFRPLCIAGMYYYILVLIIEYIGNKIEKRLKYIKY